MVHGVKALFVLDPLEERKIRDPQEIVAPLRDQPVFAAKVEPESPERREDRSLRATDHQ